MDPVSISVAMLVLTIVLILLGVHIRHNPAGNERCRAVAHHRGFCRGRQAPGHRTLLRHF